MMAYTFVGFLSPEDCWIKVYRFDPCSGVGKSVLALKSCIFIDGKCVGKIQNMENYIFGLFEVVEQCETSKKYNYATIIRRVENCMDMSIPESMPTEFNYVNRMFYGILLDHNKSTDMYLLGLGSSLCQLPAANFSMVPYVGPETLSSSVVCVVLKTGSVYDIITNRFHIIHMEAKSFKAMSFWEDEYTNFSGHKKLQNLDTQLVSSSSSSHTQEWLQPLLGTFERPSFQGCSPAVPFPGFVSPWFVRQTWKRDQTLMSVAHQGASHLNYQNLVSPLYPLMPRCNTMAMRNSSTMMPPNMILPHQFPVTQRFLRPLVPRHKVQAIQKPPQNLISPFQYSEYQQPRCITPSPQQFGLVPRSESSQHSANPAPADMYPQRHKSASSSFSLKGDTSNGSNSPSSTNHNFPSQCENYMDSLAPVHEVPSINVKPFLASSEVQGISHPSSQTLQEDKSSPAISEDNFIENVSVASTSPDGILSPRTGQYAHSTVSTDGVSTFQSKSPPLVFSNLAESRLDTNTFSSNFEDLLKNTVDPSIFSPCSHSQDCIDVQPLPSDMNCPAGQSRSLQLSPVSGTSLCPSACAFPTDQRSHRRLQSCFDRILSMSSCPSLSHSSPLNRISQCSYTHERDIQHSSPTPDISFQSMNHSSSSLGLGSSSPLAENLQPLQSSLPSFSDSALQSAARSATQPQTRQQVQPAPGVLGDRSSQIAPPSSALISTLGKTQRMIGEGRPALSEDASAGIAASKSTGLLLENGPSQLSVTSNGRVGKSRAEDLFDYDEIASLTLKELEDLAPALTGHQRIYESYGMYEKPLITIG